MPFPELSPERVRAVTAVGVRYVAGVSRPPLARSAALRGAFAAAAALGLGLAAAPALANGRFPAADQILLDPGDPSHLALRATFGLLQSRDGGQSWTWICENAVGYMGDPALALLGGGNLLAGFFGSVSMSAEQGCAWSTASLETRYQYALDATLDPVDPGRAWLLTVSVDGTRQVNLLAIDAAGTIVEALPVGTGFVPSTVEVALSDPNRIYVTGAIENEPSLVLRSRDRGQRWERFSVELLTGMPLFISAIDPRDPDRVYARIDGLPDTAVPAGMRPPSDHLLVSRDGGESWDTVFSVDGDLFGFALSPAGSRVAVGGPELGVNLASADELVFQRSDAPVLGLRCLRWTPEGLFACGSEGVDGWTVGRSRDDGQSFEALWRVQDLRPLACDAATAVGAACPAIWPEIARTIGAATTGMPAVNPPGGGIEPVPGGGSAPKSGDGGCSLGGSSQAPFSALLLAGAALARRRRRQGTSM